MSILDDVKVGDVFYVPRYSGYGRSEITTIRKLTVVSTPKTLVRLIEEGPRGSEYRAMRSRNEHMTDWPILVGAVDEYGMRKAYPGDHPMVEKARDDLKRRASRDDLKRRACRLRARSEIEVALKVLRYDNSSEALRHCRQAIEWLERS